MHLLATVTVAAVIGSAGMVVVDYVQRPGEISGLAATYVLPSSVLFWTAMTFPYILAALLGLGLPISWLLMKARLENPLTYAVAGIAAGLLFDHLLLQLSPAWGAAFGVTCALSWWFIARRHTDDAAPQST